MENLTDFIPATLALASSNMTPYDRHPSTYPGNTRNLSICWCEFGNDDGDAFYTIFNLIVIVFALPATAVIGMLGNAATLFIYSRREMRATSISFYLAALALSDFGVDLSGILGISVDSAREFSETINEVHLRVIKYMLPLCNIAQMCSVYFTVLAAFDCFIIVCVPSLKSKLCNPRAALIGIFAISVWSTAYNAIVFAEIVIEECFDADVTNSTKWEVCPTMLRMDAMYNSVYKVYMYGLFMTILPFLALLILNSLIVFTLTRGVRKPSAQSSQNKGDDPTIMLLMVVALFLICNSIALVVNVIESIGIFGDDADAVAKLMYLIDSSNYLVVLNSSANFIIYIIFAKSYRDMLSNLIFHCSLHVEPTLPKDDTYIMSRTSLASPDDSRMRTDTTLSGLYPTSPPYSNSEPPPRLGGEKFKASEIQRLLNVENSTDTTDGWPTLKALNNNYEMPPVRKISGCSSDSPGSPPPPYPEGMAGFTNLYTGLPRTQESVVRQDGSLQLWPSQIETTQFVNGLQVHSPPPGNCIALDSNLKPWGRQSHGLPSSDTLSLSCDGISADFSTRDHTADRLPTGYNLLQPVHKNAKHARAKTVGVSGGKTFANSLLGAYFGRNKSNGSTPTQTIFSNSHTSTYVTDAISAGTLIPNGNSAAKNCCEHNKSKSLFNKDGGGKSVKNGPNAMQPNCWNDVRKTDGSVNKNI